MRTEHARQGERGSVLVELGIAIPVLVSLILGTITAGQAYFLKIGVAEAVREGARYGASLALGTGSTAVTDWEASVRDRVADQSGGQVGSADVCARLVLATGATDCGVADPSGASAETSIHLVKVSATTPATIEFFFFSTTSNLTHKLAARYERDTG